MTPERLLADKARYETVATLILRQALAEGRSAELLLSLLAGAACTIDQSGRLKIVWPDKTGHGPRFDNEAPGELDQLDQPREEVHDLRQEPAYCGEPRELG